MLISEYDIRFNAAEKNFLDKINSDLDKYLHRMNVCMCGNMQLLWMNAIAAADPRTNNKPGITENELQSLFCRMGAGGELPPSSGGTAPPPPTTYLFEWAWTSVDPFAMLQAGPDTLTYYGAQVPVGASSVFADYRSSPLNSYLVARYPVAQPQFTQWYNDQFNYGVFPDSNFRALFTARGYNYIVSRIGLSLDPATLTKFF